MTVTTGLVETDRDYVSLDLPPASRVTLTVGDPFTAPSWSSGRVDHEAPVATPGAIRVLLEEGSRAQDYARSVLPIHPSSATYARRCGGTWWDNQTDLLAAGGKRIIRVSFDWSGPTDDAHIEIETGTATAELTIDDLVTLANYP